MKGDNKILFSERFQDIYQLLGTLSIMYAVGEGDGLDDAAVMAATGSSKKSAPSILKLLENNGIIYRRDGLWHIDGRQFYSMSVWDLLLVAEPWLGGGDLPGKGPDGREPFMDFCCTVNLSSSYIP